MKQESQECDTENRSDQRMLIILKKIIKKKLCHCNCKRNFTVEHPRNRKIVN